MPTNNIPRPDLAEAGQPVRWPSERPTVLLGWMELPDVRVHERYLHLGPLTFNVERERRRYKARVGFRVGRLSAHITVRF